MNSRQYLAFFRSFRFLLICTDFLVKFHFLLFNKRFNFFDPFCLTLMFDRARMKKRKTRGSDLIEKVVDIGAIFKNFFIQQTSAFFQRFLKIQQ